MMRGSYSSRREEAGVAWEVLQRAGCGHIWGEAKRQEGTTAMQAALCCSTEGCRR
jgi:hypothetical protein